MTSILDTEYVPPSRPVSQNELKDTRSSLKSRLHLSDVYANHIKCGHFYMVKKNGRKEKEIKDTESPDGLNCSVCWKFSKTPKTSKDRARHLIEDYCKVFCEEPGTLVHEIVDLEKVFYEWLYEQVN